MITDNAVEIDAPATVVWDVYSDVERWPEWTASVTRLVALDGPGLAVGKRYEIKQPRMPKLVWEVTDVTPGVGRTGAPARSSRPCEAAVYLSTTEAAVLPTTLVSAPRPAPAPASGKRRIWPMLGPAFVAAVAYVDGQHPTNTPHDGDISICANCSGLSVFEGSELRLPTPNELAKSMRDQRLLRAIKEVRSALYGWEVF